MSVDESLLCSFQILKPASKKKKREFASSSLRLSLDGSRSFLKLTPLLLSLASLSRIRKFVPLSLISNTRANAQN